MGKVKPIILGERKSALQLYHGSKGGVVGDIQPVSRRRCDFGQGFYMGSFSSQAFSLVVNSKEPKYYDCFLDLSGLKVVELSGLQWLIFVGYNRGVFLEYSDTLLFHSIPEFFNGADIIVGDIADDSIYPAFQQFSDGLLTLDGLKAALLFLKLGQQWVAKTPLACARIVLRERALSALDITRLKEFETERSTRSQTVLREVARQYRGVGKTFDDLVYEGILDETFEHLRIYSV